MKKWRENVGNGGHQEEDHLKDGEEDVDQFEDECTSIGIVQRIEVDELLKVLVLLMLHSRYLRGQSKMIVECC